MIITLTFDDSQLAVTPSVLNFTRLDWNMLQTITVEALDDRVVEGNHQRSITFTTFSMASDLVPSLGTGAGVLQRVALWILTAGLLALAAAFHPRPDEGSKSRRIALGAASPRFDPGVVAA